MADASASSPFIIRGITSQGGRFRPSDWAERLAGAFAVIDPDNRMNYSSHVQPTTLDGIKCVIVDKQFKAEDPHAYRFLLEFARSNDLVIENSD